MGWSHPYDVARGLDHSGIDTALNATMASDGRCMLYHVEHRVLPLVPVPALSNGDPPCGSGGTSCMYSLDSVHTPPAVTMVDQLQSPSIFFACWTRLRRHRHRDPLPDLWPVILSWLYVLLPPGAAFRWLSCFSWTLSNSSSNYYKAGRTPAPPT